MKFQLCMHAIVVTAALTLSAGAYAHGDNKHNKQSEAVEKEQVAWGIAADKSEVSRTVKVTMHDTMRFEPSSFTVKDGEAIRFVIHNKGKLMHEFVLGDDKTLDEHAAMMVKFPNMEHEEPYMAHVAPGKTGEILWKFNRSGNFKFACLIAGHYQAGMIGELAVEN